MIGAAAGTIEVAVLRVDDITKAYSYGGFQVPAVNQASFTLDMGGFAGLFGPNGAGKTTLLKVVVGLLKPDSGDVHVGGQSVLHSPVAAKRLIGYVSQDHAVMSSVTVYEELLFQARSFGLGRAESKVAAMRVANQLGIADLLRRDAIRLSGGQRRRVEIAMALVHSPRLLVLDEPTLGLDPETRSSLWAIIEGIRQETGVAVLMSTHYLDEAANLMSRVIVMDSGRVVAQGMPRQIIAEHAQGAIRLMGLPGRAENVAQLVTEIAVGLDTGVSVDVDEDRVTIHLKDPECCVAHILAVLQSAGITPKRVTMCPASISDAFKAITGREIADV